MLYGTAHDDLNGNGTGLSSPAGALFSAASFLSRPRRAYSPGSGIYQPGLSGLSAVPTTTDFINALVLGIAPNGSPYAKIGNNYYSDLQSVYNAMMSASNSGQAIDPIMQGSLNLLWNSALGQAMGQPGAYTHDPVQWTLQTQTLSSAIGALRAKYPQVAFYAYTTPPPAVFIPPSTTSSTATPVVTSGQLINIKKTFDYTKPWSAQVKLDNGVILTTDVASWTQDGPWAFVDNGKPIGPDIRVPPAPLVIADGYEPLLENSFTEPFPLYGQASNASGIWTLSVGFDGFVSPYTGAGGTYMNLDRTKLSSGIYVYKRTELGPITGANNRSYLLSSLDIIDSSNGNHIGTFYYTVEGGGSGNWLDANAANILRAVADVYTFGYSEIVHAADEKTAKKVDAIIGGAEIAVGAALLTGGVAIGASGAILAVGGGAVSGGLAPDATSAITNSLIAGAIVGIGSDIAQINQDPVSSAVNGASDIPQATAYTPGSTPSDIAVSPASDFGEPLTETIVPPVTPSGTSIIPQSITQAGSSVAKVASAAVISTGTTALVSELKKLAGQSPKAPSGSGGGILIIPSTTTPPPATTTPLSGKTLLVLGGAALLGILKKARG